MQTYGRKRNMNTTHTRMGIIAGALLSGGLGLAALGWERVPPTPTAHTTGAQGIPRICRTW
jgi:hypothetical protein